MHAYLQGRIGFGVIGNPWIDKDNGIHLGSIDAPLRGQLVPDSTLQGGEPEQVVFVPFDDPMHRSVTKIANPIEQHYFLAFFHLRLYAFNLILAKITPPILLSPSFNVTLRCVSAHSHPKLLELYRFTARIKKLDQRKSVCYKFLTL